MPLGEHHPNSVVFVCADRGGAQVPVGTAFLIAMPRDPDNWRLGQWRYVVTARHVVEHGGPTSIRLRRRDVSAPTDIAVPEWVQHPTADVAVAPCDVDTTECIATFITTDSFADRWDYSHGVPIQTGDPVFLIGLLSDLRSMTDRSIPMVRAGRIGALFQEDIPVRQGKYRRIEPRAHLVDAHSRSGFSGAPCVIEHLSIDVPKAAVFPYLAILGVVIGHFDSHAEVLSKDDSEDDHETGLRVLDNQGVAIVTPIEAVRDVLQTEALMEDRERRDARAKQQREAEDWQNAATLDLVAGSSEFAQFQDLTRKLVNVPKKELDAKREQES